jgi:hypothetical protein
LKSAKGCFNGVERPYKLIFCILRIQKSEIDEVAEVMFQVGEWLREQIICFLDVLKCDFDYVDEAMIEGVARPCELIFGILRIHKSFSEEVAELMFKVGKWP